MAVASTTPVARPEGRVAALFREWGELTAFSFRALAGAAGAGRYASEVLRQVSIIIRGTTLLTLVMNAFLGMSVINFGFFFFRSIGASDYTGIASGYVDIRQCANIM